MYEAWQKFRLYETRDLNDEFDCNDTGGILRDVYADVKKFCIGLEASTVASRPRRSSTGESRFSAQSATQAGESKAYTNLKDEIRRLTHAVAANTQTLAGSQVSSELSKP